MPTPNQHNIGCATIELMMADSLDNLLSLTDEQIMEKIKPAFDAVPSVASSVHGKPATIGQRMDSSGSTNSWPKGTKSSKPREKKEDSYASLLSNLSLKPVVKGKEFLEQQSKLLGIEMKPMPKTNKAIAEDMAKPKSKTIQL